MSVHLHQYTREFGGTQQELVLLYLKLGKSYDEIQQLLKCPRASIRRINSYSIIKKSQIMARLYARSSNAYMEETMLGMKIPNIERH